MLRDRLGLNTRVEPGEELDQLSNAVIGAAIEVHRLLGPGLHESVYERALCVELKLRGIPFERQAVVPVTYKGEWVGEARLDVLVAGKLVVELKAVDALLPIHKAQLISYLQLTKHLLGMLLNFNVRVLKDGIKRVVVSQESSPT